MRIVFALLLAACATDDAGPVVESRVFTFDIPAVDDGQALTVPSMCLPMPGGECEISTIIDGVQQRAAWSLAPDPMNCFDPEPMLLTVSGYTVHRHPRIIGQCVAQ